LEGLAMPNVDWKLDAVELVTCNCDFSCPCQFNAPPTYGDCRAAAAYRIDKGHFGDTSLDGVKFVGLWAWPGAIHEGNGEAQLIMDENASAEQFEAVQALFHGEETEPGATIFNVFSNVIVTYHEPQRKPIRFEADIEARTGHFEVPGVIKANSEPIKNPITGDPHRAIVTLPHGFEYDQAEYASSNVSTDDSVIPLQWQNSHAHFAHLVWTPAGPVHA
ncbi:MAG: DUF1326 domain-containing protein, partial [bacterium]